MTKNSLRQGQRRTLEIIEELGFGLIEALAIRDGLPCYDQPPQIRQEIRLGSAPERRSGRSDADLTLKKEFEVLFNELQRFGTGSVDIEIRHSIPFRLILRRSDKELTP